MPRRILVSATIAGTLLALSGALLMATSGAAQGGLTVEVAEIGARFAPDPSLADDDGNPLRGATFVTEGYIYEAGTLSCTEDGACDGVADDEDGNPSPEYPDAVIGTWTCYGVFTEAATATSGSFVATTQIFDLGDGAGEDIIVTTGQEFIDVGLAIRRVVTGGTGAYAGIDGVQTQTLIGFNNAELSIDDVPLFGLVWTNELPTG